ncbi:MAG TPA: hypothetical protein VF885_03170 [Arthrobacter sp.]
MSNGDQPYPHTPQEHERSFIAKARAVEEQLFRLSQAIYNEIMAVRDENPPTFTQVAADIKKVLDEGLATISAGFLAGPALAADKAWGYPVAGQGEEAGPPHT